jgi:ABC-type branched-subunit amino acid transport system ATPase component
VAEILRIERLTKHFGGVAAVNGPTFGVEEGRITGLIGPNGSGKTTLFNLVTGVLDLDGGRVLLGRQDITGWPPHRISERGMARTFQISRVFGKMTVWENMLVVARRGAQTTAPDLARDLLGRVNLLDWRERYGSELSYGQQKLLEFVRALMLEPTLILLDEPFAGVNPTMVQTILALIRSLQQEGKSFFVIDHAMAIIMELCDRLLVLDMGELIADGAPAAIKNDERVQEAYFGRASIADSGVRT